MRPTVSAHIEMTTSRGYSATERIDVLESIVERYAAAENIGQNLRQLNPACIRTPYLEDFLEPRWQACRPAQALQCFDAILQRAMPY